MPRASSSHQQGVFKLAEGQGDLLGGGGGGRRLWLWRGEGLCCGLPVTLRGEGTLLWGAPAGTSLPPNMADAWRGAFPPCQAHPGSGSCDWLFSPRGRAQGHRQPMGSRRHLTATRGQGNGRRADHLSRGAEPSAGWSSSGRTTRCCVSTPTLPCSCLTYFHTSDLLPFLPHKSPMPL